MGQNGPRMRILGHLLNQLRILGVHANGGVCGDRAMNLSKMVKFFSIAGGALLLSFAAHAAPAPTAEVAKKCREMMIKAYPPVRPGSKTGNAQQQREYFQTCIAQKGKMEGDSPLWDRASSERGAPT